MYKKGEMLSGFEKDFIYKEQYLSGAEFEVRAAEDICTPDHQKDADGNRIVLYAKDTLVTTITTGESPEESIYQLGTIDEHASVELLVLVFDEFKKEFDERFGSNVHIIDWSLHMDEATPHIHERHVFDATNQYGEIEPKQEAALKELGFELPNSEKKRSKTNNRKVVFDSACRTMFLDICKRHGLELDEEPSYGGRKYLERFPFTG